MLYDLYPSLAHISIIMFLSKEYKPKIYPSSYSLSPEFQQECDNTRSYFYRLYDEPSWIIPAIYCFIIIYPVRHKVFLIGSGCKSNLVIEV